MKVLPGALVTSFSGSAGGQTIQNGRYGFIMRNKPIPTKTESPAQQDIRGKYQEIAHTWGTLTQPQRDLWDTTALNWPQTDIFGNPFFLSGFGLYTKLNLVRRALTLSLLVVPMDPTVVVQFLTFTVALNAAMTGFDLTFTATPTPADQGTQIYATRPLPAGVKVPGNTFKQIDLMPPATASPYDTLTAYSDTFGFLPPSGSNLFFRILPSRFDRGQQGIALDANFIMP